MFVGETVLLLFSRVRIPGEILFKKGNQFTSQLMEELHKEQGVKPLFTITYYPMGNGPIERFHATLKASLRKLCSDKPKEWPHYFVPNMFALSDIPNARNCFLVF